MSHTKGTKRKKSDLEKTKIKYKQLYDSWKKVFCPALNADVDFTHAGWNHLCVLKWRTGVEQEKRLKLLPLTKKLISITTTIQATRFQDGFITHEFNAIMDGTKVTAVVSKTKTGYIYWTTFGA